MISGASRTVCDRDDGVVVLVVVVRTLPITRVLIISPLLINT